MNEKEMFAMRKIARFWVLLVFLGMSATGFANSGDRSGNGGDGVRIGTKTYLFDFYESGIHQVPAFKDPNATDLVLQEIVERSLDRSEFPTRLLVAKLIEIKEKFPVLAYVLVRAIPMLSWQFSPSLLNVEDAGDTVLDPSQKLDLVQLAVRRDGAVRISKEDFQAMDQSNQVGLILHEIVYALSENQVMSGNARAFNSYLFSKSVQRERPQDILAKVPFVLEASPMRPGFSSETFDRDSLIVGMGVQFYNQYDLGSLLLISDPTAIAIQLCVDTRRDGFGSEVTTLQVHPRYLSVVRREKNSSALKVSVQRTGPRRYEVPYGKGSNESACKAAIVSLANQFSQLP